MDDGQLVCAPEAYDPWLRAFDAEIAKFRATRGQGSKVKSLARLIYPDGRVEEFQG